MKPKKVDIRRTAGWFSVRQTILQGKEQGHFAMFV
jgi:hypothetical protein